MLILDRGVKCQAVLSKTLIEETINQILLHNIIIIIFNYILILHWFKHYLLKDNSLSLLFL